MAAYEFWRVGVEYTAGTVTDITQYVDTLRGPISATTGATQETTGEPASLSLTLNNTGLRFTSGSLALQTGMKILFWETIGYSTFYLFTGYIEFPEIDDANMSATQDQQISVYAVDQLARWARTETYVSTLAAHIMNSAPAANLVAYWPLHDFPAFRSLVGNYPLVPVAALNTNGATAQTLYGAADAGVYGDDIGAQAFTPNITATTADMVYLSSAVNIAVATGQYVTVCAWIKPSPPGQFGGNGLPFFIGDAAGNNKMTMFDALAGGTAEVTLNAVVGDAVLSRTFPIDTWRLVTMRVKNISFSATVDLWCGSDLTATTSIASVAVPITFDHIQIGTGWWGGDIAHVQVYVGSTGLSYADHLAQNAVGMAGLDWQRTGARINTLADYAGFPTNMRDISPGASVMQPARLAGLTIADALEIARTTEQGDLYIDGAGRLVFRDRPYINNV